MTGPARILLVTGSTRSRSTNTAALRTLQALAAAPQAAEPGTDTAPGTAAIRDTASAPETAEPDPAPAAEPAAAAEPTAAAQPAPAAAAAAEPAAAVTAVLYEELAGLPAFNPDDDHEPLPPAVAHLRREIAAADAVVFCTPEYAGGLPGSFKNLLDWTVGGGEIYRKPVAWINIAAEGRGNGAQQSLAQVLGYVGGVSIEAACRRITVLAAAVGPDGLVADPGFRSGATQVLRAILSYLSAGENAGQNVG